MRILIGEYDYINLIDNNGTKTMLIPQETAVVLFRKIAIQETNYRLNELAMYSFGSVGRSRKASFLSLQGPKHLIQKRGANGCTWTPKGKITNQITEIDMAPVKVEMEICPDALWDSCFENILEVGNGVNDFYASAEGQELLNHILTLVYTGLGNSYAELVEFGKHPLIDDADAGSWFTIGQDEWDDYKDQQTAVAGFMTLVDDLKAEGHANFGYSINQADMNGADFTGDAMALLTRVINAAKGELSTYLKKAGVGMPMATISVSTGIYDRLEEQFISQYNAIPESYYFKINGSQPLSNGLTSMPGVLKYKGCWVVRRDDWAAFDDITGTTTHRALLSVPGNFGLVHDVSDVQQFNGQGLVIQKSPLLKDGGKIWMKTNYDVATAILDTNLMINFSETKTA